MRLKGSVSCIMDLVLHLAPVTQISLGAVIQEESRSWLDKNDWSTDLCVLVFRTTQSILQVEVNEHV